MLSHLSVYCEYIKAIDKELVIMSLCLVIQMVMSAHHDGRTKLSSEISLTCNIVTCVCWIISMYKYWGFMEYYKFIKSIYAELLTIVMSLSTLIMVLSIVKHRRHVRVMITLVAFILIAVCMVSIFNKYLMY